MQVVSSDASIAVPDVGPVAHNPAFPAGGANTATFKVRGVAREAQLASEVAAGNHLTVAVISDPG